MKNIASILRRIFPTRYRYYGGAGLIVNLLLVIAALLLSSKFNGFEALCYTVGAISVLAGLVSLVEFLLGDFKWHETLPTLSLHAVATILTFAAIYAGYGLENGASSLPAPSFDIALYYSIVTWTTLGYGDYVAPLGIKLIAAMEAMAGFIFLGALVGLVGNRISETDSKSSS